MRNLLKTHIVEMPVGIPEALSALHRVVHPKEIISPPAGIKEVEHATSFSQRSRRTVMIDNARKACFFMEEQQRVVKKLIKEFQIFTGYIEQLPKTGGLVDEANSWSVYLMHAQSLHSAMKQTHQGKALFGDGAAPPVRVHLEEASSVVPFDLPDPSLVSMVSVRAFLSGVADHKLPSVALGNACMADLLNALIEIQQGRERLSSISRNFKRPVSISVTEDKPTRPVYRLSSKAVSWHEKFVMQIQSIFSPESFLKQRG